jgi:prepilin-type N-terminal cleavage/methylation domain-containing protein
VNSLSHDSESRHSPVEAFSLLEMLVAVAVLAIMMTFMFGLVAQTIRAWESGSRQIEGAQAARVALDRMSRDLQYAIAGSKPVVRSAGVITNVAPFFAETSPTGIPGEKTKDLRPPLDSAQLFAVAPVADPRAVNGPFAESGYLCVQCVDPIGYHVLAPFRYYLVWHNPADTDDGNDVLEPVTDVYYRGAGNTNWIGSSVDQITTGANRMAMVDNCYQMLLRFATNNANGELEFTDEWPSRTSLPAGVLVTLKVMDKKTAARIAQLKGKEPLEDKDLAADSTTAAGRILREGSVEVSRFIPFLNSTN